jgi:hypothetical protein
VQLEAMACGVPALAFDHPHQGWPGWVGSRRCWGFVSYAGRI